MKATCIVCGGTGDPCSIRNMAMMRCPACSFLWLKDKILSADYYDTVDSGMDPVKNTRRLRNAGERIRTFRKYLALDRTCDIGTGEGIVLQALRDHGYTGCFGIEPSEACVGHARSLGLDVVRGTIDDVIALTQNRTVGAFALFHVIEHLDDPEKDMRLLHEALPQGGHLIIETPNQRGFSARKYGEQWDLYYPEHLWYFSDKTLPRFLERCGFHIVAVGKRDFDPRGKSIAELLWRIGLLPGYAKKRDFTGAAPKMHGQRPKNEEVAAAPKPKTFAQRCLPFLRTILSALMRWSGQVDHVWVIARKI